MPNTTPTLAFDVYGTLIDTHGVVSKLQQLIGEQAAVFSQSWRDKQLEYAFRRGLMDQYADFSVCTRDALNFTCAQYQVNLDDDEKQALLQIYRTLPAFADVEPGLQALRELDTQLFAFSNGSQQAVNGLLSHAKIQHYFCDTISVEDVQTFKPNPAVYQYLLAQSGATANQAWLISSNPFDVIGALYAGMHAIWVQRSNHAIFDPWGIEPTATVSNLAQIADVIQP